MGKPNVVLAEFDTFLADSYSSLLSKFFTIYHAKTAQQTIDILDTHKIDLLITDTILGRHNGVEIIHEMRSYEDWAKIPVIILSSLPVADFPINKRSWTRYGIVSFLYKPVTKPGDLLREVTAELV